MGTKPKNLKLVYLFFFVRCIFSSSSFTRPFSNRKLVLSPSRERLQFKTVVMKSYIQLFDNARKDKK